MQKFLKSTKTISPTGNSGATSTHPIGDSFIYIETRSKNHGPNVFCSFERTDNIQIIKNAFDYKIFSAGSSKSMGNFRIQPTIGYNTWSTQKKYPKLIDLAIRQHNGFHLA